MQGTFIDKTKKILNSIHLSKKYMQNMFCEFCMGKDLVHPNIVEYMFFQKIYDSNSQKYDFHMIIELLEGKDLKEFI